MTNNVPKTKMQVQGYSRATEHKETTWYCVHCCAKTVELRLPGAYLPYYCDICGPEVKRKFDRLRQRDYRQGKRITKALEALDQIETTQQGEELGKIRAQLVDLLNQVVTGRKSFAEQTYLYCGDCGYKYQEDDRLDRHCPGCGVAPLAARSHALLRLAWTKYWHSIVDYYNFQIKAIQSTRLDPVDLADFNPFEVE